MRVRNRFAEGEALTSEAADGFRRFGAPLLEAAAREVADDCEAALALYRLSIQGLAGRATDGQGRVQPLPRSRCVAWKSRQSRTALVPRARDRWRSRRGRTVNLEIARSLSISHKTVEKHLGSAFRNSACPHAASAALPKRAAAKAGTAEASTHTAAAGASVGYACTAHRCGAGCCERKLRCDARHSEGHLGDRAL